MQRRMLSMIAAAGLGLSLAALVAPPSFAATTATPDRAAAAAARAAAAPAAAAAAECRTLDFDTAQVTPVATTGSVSSPTTRYLLSVTGVLPSTDVKVSLVPLVYITRPVYWGIRVTGCSSGVGLPVLTTYTATYGFTGTMGTCGIEVTGASRSQQFDLAGCGRSPLTGTRWTLDPASLGVPVPEKSPITAAFSATTMSGSSSCNIYSASYTASADGTFSLGPIRSTARACDPESMLAESTYVKRLMAAKRYSVSPKQLLLGNDPKGSAAPLSFTPDATGV